MEVRQSLNKLLELIAKNTQFEKGKSGNPKGRPKGSQNPATIFNRVAREFITVTENGRTRKLTKLEAIILQAHNKALAGKPKSFSDYLNFYKAFVLSVLPEADEVTVVPQRHSPVFAEIVRRLRESEVQQARTPHQPPPHLSL
ncbi:MAG: DUF5681 domain-containing protein [Acidobacteriaceae bacterium]